jgi:hypothetical protein
VSSPAAVAATAVLLLCLLPHTPPALARSAAKGARAAAKQAVATENKRSFAAGTPLRISCCLQGTPSPLQGPYRVPVERWRLAAIRVQHKGGAIRHG